MGIIEVDKSNYQIHILSDIFLYGNAISEEIRQNMEEEINTMWNEPRGLVWIENIPYLVEFHIQVFLSPSLQKETIFENKNPKNNYFRIEEFVHGNISFVDGLHCNTGLFKLENLYKGSTTSAHEYGHTLGLPHPENCDIRGKGTPGIMYPRGTLVDAKFQYEENAIAGEKGGTLYPIHRKVLQNDIDNLGLKNYLTHNKNIIGKFSNVYHEEHYNGAKS